MWIAVILFFFLLGLLAHLDARKPKNYPPGPGWYPLIGCALLIFKLRKKTGFTYRAFEELSQIYGPVVGLKAGRDRLILCSSKDAAMEALSKEEFDGRPTGPFFVDRTWGTCRGLALVDGPFWTEQKRFVVQALRKFGFGRRTMSDVMEKEALLLLTIFRKAVAKGGGRSAVIPMKNICIVPALNATWYIIAGIRHAPEDKEMKHLLELLKEIVTSYNVIGSIFNQFPFLRWLAPEKSGYKRFIDIHHDFWKFFRAELDRHKATFKVGEPRDLIDVYLEVLCSENCPATFSESQLLAICMDLFMVGSETTDSIMAFGLLYMLHHPEVQVRAQEEIDCVVGRSQLPTLGDRHNMPYMESIVLEMLRLAMGRTINIPHRALRDGTIQGYHVPKNTILLVNFHHLLMSSTYWDEPELFKPERFINADNKVTIPDIFKPFGFGKRKCIGESLGQGTLFLFMATVLQNFTLSCVPGEDLPSKLGVDGISPSTGAFSALVSVRD